MAYIERKIAETPQFNHKIDEKNEPYENRAEDGAKIQHALQKQNDTYRKTETGIRFNHHYNRDQLALFQGLIDLLKDGIRNIEQCHRDHEPEHRIGEVQDPYKPPSQEKEDNRGYHVRTESEDYRHTEKFVEIILFLIKISPYCGMEIQGQNNRKKSDRGVENAYDPVIGRCKKPGKNRYGNKAQCFCNDIGGKIVLEMQECFNKPASCFQFIQESDS
ncbi:MAG: hypothetical protein JXQ30_04725 [Spirochaetes bacterium]|nr:hypothetical protein [Spirochaetota bacterium]